MSGVQHSSYASDPYSDAMYAIYSGPSETPLSGSSGLWTESHAGEAATHDHMMSPIKARRGEVIVGLSVHDAHGDSSDNSDFTASA